MLQRSPEPWRLAQSSTGKLRPWTAKSIGRPVDDVVFVVNYRGEWQGLLLVQRQNTGLGEVALVMRDGSRTGLGPNSAAARR